MSLLMRLSVFIAFSAACGIESLATEPQGTADRTSAQTRCEDVQIVANQLRQMRSSDWSTPWTSQRLSQLLGSNPDFVRDNANNVIAYTWTHSDGPIQCLETVVPSPEGGIQRILVRRIARTPQDARVAGAALVDAMVGDVPYADPKAWSTVAADDWREIERVPANAELPQRGTLELGLRQTGQWWTVEVAYGTVR